MSDAHDSAQRALKEIPGWSGAEVTALKGGRTNTTWLVEKSARRATLKVDPSPRGFPFADREKEADVQRLAAANSIANDVIYASPTVLLTDFVDGRVWTAGDLRDEHNLASLGRLLRCVHGLPRTGKRFDALRAGCLYAQRSDTGGNAGRKAVDEHLGILRSLPASTEICCCHNDVVAENILATPVLRLIDWEYACDNDPMFDVAIVVVHHDLDDVQTAVLLDAYAGNRSGLLQERLSREIRRYRSLAWLWQVASP